MPDEPAEAPPATDPTPAERLKALKGELQTEEDALSTLTKARDALKGDVDSLGKTVDEIEKAKAAYEKTLASLKDDRDKLDGYQKTVAPMLAGVLGPKKANVDAAIKGVDDAITDQGKEVDKAKAAAVNAANEAQTAQRDLDARLLDYDSYKTLQKDLGDKIKQIQGFKSTIDKFDDAKPASMYVYLRELQKVLSATDVKEKAAFEAKLNELWKKLDKSRGTMREKKLALEAANVKVDTESAKLAALQKNQVEDLLKATDQFN